MRAASSITTDVTLPGIGKQREPEPTPGRVLLGDAMKACAALIRHAEAANDDELMVKATRALEALMAGMFIGSEETPR